MTTGYNPILTCWRWTENQTGFWTPPADMRRRRHKEDPESLRRKEACWLICHITNPGRSSWKTDEKHVETDCWGDAVLWKQISIFFFCCLYKACKLCGAAVVCCQISKTTEAGAHQISTVESMTGCRAAVLSCIELPWNFQAFPSTLETDKHRNVKEKVSLKLWT